MTKQQIFKEKYVQKLRNELKVEWYKNNEFIFDKKEIMMLPNIEKPQGLIEKLLQNIEDDCTNAIFIYEAFPSLEPIQASDERFWVYLSHVDLYPYMIKRWDAVYNNTAKEGNDYILDHWFLVSSAHGNLLRHALAGLWWSVHLSIDDTKDDKYELTKILFRQLDFPTRTLGAYKLGRHKEAVIGILEFINENEELFKSKFEDKSRFITKYLNSLGGVKPIVYYDRLFFKDELKKIKGKLSEL